MIREAWALARFVSTHPIGRRRPVRCLFDTLRWQLTASAKPRVVAFAGDARLWARRSETGVTGNVYVGLHEFADMAFVAHLLRPGDLFADIGANAGSYTVLAAKVAGARVVAVEPVPEAADRLDANVALHGVGDRVVVHRVAVSDRGGTVRFTADGDTVNRIASGDASGRSLIEVPATTLDALFAERSPRVVKIDVEGHEGAVLDGGRRLLASDEVAALVVEMGEQGDRAGRSLVEHGFEAARYEPFARNLTRGPGPGRAGNAIWVRDRAWAEARLREARPISVKGVAV